MVVALTRSYGKIPITYTVIWGNIDLYIRIIPPNNTTTSLAFFTKQLKDAIHNILQQAKLI